jgi:hypothetical protein
MAPSIKVPRAVSDAFERAGDFVQDNKTAVAATAGAVTAASLGLYLYRRAKNAVPKSGPYKPETLPAGAYDAVIVGAGGLPARAAQLCAPPRPRGGPRAARAAGQRSESLTPAPARAGPSGSVCSYYLAKQGAKVALLDKEKFPRDKVGRKLG